VNNDMKRRQQRSLNFLLGKSEGPLVAAAHCGRGTPVLCRRRAFTAKVEASRALRRAFDKAVREANANGASEFPTKEDRGIKTT
jgi:hypothetical protein